jgi:fatty acid desaturase
VEVVGRVSALLGYATAWLGPNPFSVVAMSLAIYVRWTGVAHPVLHRGYDRCEGAPREKHSKRFGAGWRRIIDWFDWIAPPAWAEEHNVQHHYRLNEEADPDLVERNLSWLREAKLPRAVKLAIVPLLAATWKWIYYAPSTMEVLERTQARRRQELTREQAQSALDSRWSERGFWSFLPKSGTSVWLRCWLPYLAFRFVLLPALFLPLGGWAAACVLINSLLAELLTNLHAFATIVPSHAAEDLYRFEGRAGGRPEFYLRQALGSANYRTGGFANDLMHGWLNYQIEHHLFPDLSLLAQEKAAPRVREIFERHGVEYIQESVWVRLRKTIDIIIGERSMRRHDAGAMR